MQFLHIPFRACNNASIIVFENKSEIFLSKNAHLAKVSTLSYLSELCNDKLEQIEENPNLVLRYKMASLVYKIYSKANYVSVSIKRIIKHAYHDLLDIPHVSLVKSILAYSSIIWDSFYTKYIDRLWKSYRICP